jgi:hypothetical protein
MDELAGVAFWLIGYMIGLLLTFAGLGVAALLAYGIARLAERAPGPLGRMVRALELKEPGTPPGIVFLVLVLGFLVSLWTGYLGRLLVLTGISG